MQTPIEEKLPQPSALVRVRSRQYLVEELTPPPDPSSQTLVRLSCLDDDSQGTSLEVLWESEVDAQILQAATWQDVARKGFDPPPKFSAYLHTLRWNSVTSTNPRLFQSPLRAGIQVMTYQLEPLRKALQLCCGCRLQIGCWQKLRARRSRGRLCLADARKRSGKIEILFQGALHNRDKHRIVEDLGNLAGVLVEILRGANDVPLGRQCFIVFEGGINSSL